MTDTITYGFSGGTTITLTLAASPTNATGQGLGYTVTGVSGTYDNETITGEVGSAASPSGTDAAGHHYDDAFYTSAAAGYVGSTDGLDYYGVGFKVGATDMFLFSFGGSLYFTSDSYVFITAALTGITYDEPPVVTPTTDVIATDAAPVALATAVAFNSDPLSVTLLSDAAFATGSSLSISNGSILYTPGAITSADAGTTDTLTYKVTDTVTGNTVAETQTVTLTVNYAVLDFGSGTTLTLALAAAPADSSGFGPGYAVTAISGTYHDAAITGLLGTGTTLYSTPTGGVSGYNLDGIDAYGISFSVAGGVSVSLQNFSQNNLDFIDSTTYAYTGATLLSAASNLPPTVTRAAQVLATDAGTVLGTAASAFGDFPLSVQLLSDADFATGSSVAISNGNIVYTPGAITGANVGDTDTLTYAVTDTVTGATVDESQTVTLSNDAVFNFGSGTEIILTLAATASGVIDDLSGFAQDIGSGYGVVAISGTYDGSPIAGEYGAPGQLGAYVPTGLDAPSYFDNAIISSPNEDLLHNIDGIDYLGLAFQSGGAIHTLSTNSRFYVDRNYELPAPSITSNLQPVVVQAANLIATDLAPTVLGSAAPAFGGFPLAVTLIADSAFATGSLLSISNGSILYTPGLTTRASGGGQDTLTYRITDTVTGAAITETQTIMLANYETVTFAGGTQIVLTLAYTPTTIDDPTDGYLGLGYAVTGISGTYDGHAITRQVGTPGAVADSVDDTIFTSTAAGLGGSTDGVDYNGIGFVANGTTIDLFTSGGAFYFYTGSAYTSPALISESSSLQPLVDQASGVIATDAAPATLGSASYGGDPLSVALLSDAAFPTGSSIAISNGSILYTPGLITSADAGTTDTLTYAVTDTVTGETIDETQTVALAMPCFARGTRLAAAGGDVAVQALRIGDRLRTHAGALRPVRWIGHRRLDPLRQPAPRDVLPIRIAAGALADGVPQRDLLVSPDHALLVNGLLLPARLLLNGATITQQADVRDITYFHVELDAHDILLAEGAAAESYLDTGNRAAFANAGPAQLHPDFTGAPRRPGHGACMNLSTAPQDVEPVWRAIAARAAALGRPPALPQATTDADFRLHAAGRTLRPVEVSGARHVFVVPLGIESIWLRSRAAAPCELRPWVDDRRCLGVPVNRVVLRDARSRAEMPVDHPDLNEGWHDPERDAVQLWRWTDGRARVRLPHGTRIVEIYLSGRGEYPSVPAPADAAATELAPFSPTIPACCSRAA